MASKLIRHADFTKLDNVLIIVTGLIIIFLSQIIEPGRWQNTVLASGIVTIFIGFWLFIPDEDTILIDRNVFGLPRNEIELLKTYDNWEWFLYIGDVSVMSLESIIRVLGFEKFEMIDNTERIDLNIEWKLTYVEFNEIDNSKEFLIIFEKVRFIELEDICDILVKSISSDFKNIKTDKEYHSILPGSVKLIKGKNKQSLNLVIEGIDKQFWNKYIALSYIIPRNARKLILQSLKLSKNFLEFKKRLNENAKLEKNIGKLTSSEFSLIKGEYNEKQWKVHYQDRIN